MDIEEQHEREQQRYLANQIRTASLLKSKCSEEDAALFSAMLGLDQDPRSVSRPVHSTARDCPRLGR